MVKPSFVIHVKLILGPILKLTICLNYGYLDLVKNYEGFKNILTSSYKIKDEIDYNIYQYFWDIRLLSLSILQDRKYTMSERMIILGLFYNKLH